MVRNITTLILLISSIINPLAANLTTLIILITMLILSLKCTGRAI
jgi:hypothetical protein